MTLEPGLTKRAYLDVDSILEAAAREAATVYKLPASGLANKRAFFEAVRERLPTDPPLPRPRTVWDALSDSLWGGFDALDADRIVLIWPNAANMRRASPDDYEVALEVLSRVAASLADPEAALGHPKKVSVYVETGPD